MKIKLTTSEHDSSIYFVRILGSLAISDPEHYLDNIDPSPEEYGIIYRKASNNKPLWSDWYVEKNDQKLLNLFLKYDVIIE